MKEPVKFMITIPGLLRRNTETILATWNKMSEVLFKLEISDQTSKNTAISIGLPLAELSGFVQEARQWLTLLIQRYVVDR
jgi:hypothetical protein